MLSFNNKFDEPDVLKMDLENYRIIDIDDNKEKE